MLLTIAISSINDRIECLVPSLQLTNLCEILVVHQVTDGKVYDYGNLSERGVRIVTSYGSGLSRSRNTALSKCKTSFCLFMDDDVSLVREGIASLVDRLESVVSPIVLVTHAYSSGRLAASYPRKSRSISRLGLRKFTSVDICVNVSTMRSKGLRFDEKFGLGAQYPTGEEFIFLNDCYDAGCHAIFFPINIGIHPDFDSGMDFFSSPELVEARKRMFMKVFPSRHLIMRMLFLVKKSPVLFRNRCFFRFFSDFIL